MISLELAVAIHKVLIQQYGGSYGIRDQSLLESALQRPFQTFDNVDLYPDPVAKAAAIIESIVKNHPFIDGNKRTGYVLMRVLLKKEGLDIQASQDEKYAFVIQIAEGRIDFEKIQNWIQKNLR
jgi:death-on-curing protein